MCLTQGHNNLNQCGRLVLDRKEFATLVVQHKNVAILDIEKNRPHPIDYYVAVTFIAS